MKFGEKLRNFRRDAGLTQTQLADSIGMHVSHICKAESDCNPFPSADTIVRLCEVLRVPPEPLLALAGKIPSEVMNAVSTSIPAQEFLRFVYLSGLTDNDWRDLTQVVRRLREQRFNPNSEVAGLNGGLKCTGGWGALFE